MRTGDPHSQCNPRKSGHRPRKNYPNRQALAASCFRPTGLLGLAAKLGNRQRPVPQIVSPDSCRGKNVACEEVGLVGLCIRVGAIWPACPVRHERCIISSFSVLRSDALQPDGNHRCGSSSRMQVARVNSAGPRWSDSSELIWPLKQKFGGETGYSQIPTATKQSDGHPQCQSTTRPRKVQRTKAPSPVATPTDSTLRICVYSRFLAMTGLA